MTCKQARRDLASAIREQKAAHKEVREANARVVAATSKLSPFFPSEVQHPPEPRRIDSSERDRIQKLIDYAQKASNRLAEATSNVVNKRAYAATCAKGR